MSSIEFLKRQAKNATKHVPKISGKPFPLNQAQELIARLHGYPSWHAASTQKAVASEVPRVGPAEFAALERVRLAIVKGDCTLGHARFSLRVANKDLPSILKGGHGFRGLMLDLAVVAYSNHLYQEAAFYEQRTDPLSGDALEDALDLADMSYDMRFDESSPLRDVFVGRLWGPMERSGMHTLGEFIKKCADAGYNWRKVYAAGNFPSKIDWNWMKTALMYCDGVPKQMLAMVDDSSASKPRKKKHVVQQAQASSKIH